VRLIWNTVRWFFYALPSISGIILATASFALVFVRELDEHLRDKRKVRWALAIVLAIIGISAFVSDRVQQIEDRRERDGERKDATSERRELVSQINTLVRSSQSQATGEDVRRLATEVQLGFLGLQGVVRGKTWPVQVPVAPKPAVVEHLRFTEKRVSTDNSELPYGEQVIIQTDITHSKPRLEIDFDGEVFGGEFFMAGASVMFAKRMGVLSDQHKIILGFDFPEWVPESPLVVTVFSKQPVKVTAIKRAEY
jgi:hypothetical protein